MATLNENETVQYEQGSTPETSVEVSQNQELEEAIASSEQELATHSVETNTNMATQILAQRTIAENEQKETENLAQHMQAERSTLAQWTKAETQTLQEEIENTPKAISDREIAKIKDNETLKLVADERIQKCEALRSWIQTAEWSNKSRRELREKIQRAIKDMKKIVKDIDKLKEKWQPYSNTDNYKNRLWEIIFNYYSSREPARQIIVMWWRVPMIRWTVDSKRDAKKANNYAKNNAEYQIDMSEIKKNTALYTLIWVSANEWWDYCDFVWQWWIAIGHPVYVQHTAGFNQVRQYNPDLYRALTPEWQITYETYCQRNPQCRYQWNNWYNPNRRYRTWTIWDDIASMIEDWQRKRWKEVNPQQREARRKIWNIWSVIWCVALGFGIIKEIFNPWKDKDWNKKRNWWKILWLWAGIYGITHYKDVKSTFFDAFNLDPDNYVARRQNERAREELQNNTWLSQSETNELINAKIAYPTLVATTIWSIPIKQLIEQKIVEEKDWKLVLNKTNYATYVENIALALWRSNKDKQEMLDKIASDEAERSISYGLSYCWINTLNDLNKLKESETSTLMDSATFKTKFKEQINAITRQNWIFSNMAKQWLIPAWLNETIKILENYDSNKNENEQILERLKAEPCLLKTSPDKEYSVTDMLSSPYVGLMDLENMTMRWFKYSDWANEVKFSSYWELFETVYITEKIKYIFKWRTDAKDAIPFHVNLLWQIEFNNKEWYEIHEKDATVISLKKLKTDLPTIKNNKDAYNKYLNDWRLETL